mmetsp:Transcript_42989/g.100904  ORF Transcript_42989/g.100904 Transcript_42989/m.100904 type:complete len:144 (-) Transcript_42989:904-1335(-)
MVSCLSSIFTFLEKTGFFDTSCLTSEIFSNFATELFVKTSFSVNEPLFFCKSIEVFLFLINSGEIEVPFLASPPRARCSPLILSVGPNKVFIPCRLVISSLTKKCCAFFLLILVSQFGYCTLFPQQLLNAYHLERLCLHHLAF